MVKDPVCGMDIDEQAAAAVRQLDGHAVYLCSEACAAKFDADPGRYGGGRSQDVGSATTGVRPDTQGLVRIELPNQLRQLLRPWRFLDRRRRVSR